jgi:hypothetical protein
MPYRLAVSNVAGADRRSPTLPGRSAPDPTDSGPHAEVEYSKMGKARLNRLLEVALALADHHDPKATRRIAQDGEQSDRGGSQ